MTTTTTRDGVVYGMADAIYHSADMELSSTRAKAILKSPATLHYELTHPKKPKAEFDVGHAAHMKVLGAGTPVEVIPETMLATNGAASTKEAKEFIAAARERGSVALKSDVAAEVDEMAEAVLRHSKARAILEQDGDVEVSLFATDPITGIRMRARYDKFAAVAADVKTVAGSAAPADFARIADRLKYDVQNAHYEYVDELITGVRRPMVFIAVEKDAPHLVAVHQLNFRFMEMGRTKAARARHLFAESIAASTWAGYPEEINLIEPNMGAIYDFEDNYPNE